MRFLLVLAIVVLGAPVAHASESVVAAAADLQTALPEIAKEFSKEQGHELRLVFGATGNLAQQVRAGAPFALLLAADTETPAQLLQAGKARGAAQVYAIGRLGLFVRSDAGFRDNGDLKALRAALLAGKVPRLAIANPEHAPYGRAARAALQRAGAWNRAQERLVLGESAGQAGQFAASGSVTAALLPWSQATNPTLLARGTMTQLTDEVGGTLPQAAILLGAPEPIAEAFLRFLLSPQVGRILVQHGFGLPAPHAPGP